MNKNQSQPEAEQEIATRRDDALHRALNTPPKPHDQMKLGTKTKPKPNAPASSKKT